MRKQPMNKKLAAELKELRKFERDLNKVRENYRALPLRNRRKWEALPPSNQLKLFYAYLAEKRGKATTKQKAILAELKSEIGAYKKLIRKWSYGFRYVIVLELFSQGADFIEAIRIVDKLVRNEIPVKEYRAYVRRLKRKGIKNDIGILFGSPRKKKRQPAKK